MKRLCYLFLVFGCCSSLYAQGGPPQGFLYGIGTIVQQQPFKGIDTQTIVIPFLGYQGERLEIFGPLAQYTFAKQQDWSAQVLLAPRFDGFEASEGDAFAGLATRKNSADIGLGFTYRPNDWTWQANLRTDVLSNSNGSELRTSVERAWNLGFVQLVPSMEFMFLDDNLTNYYFGVRNNEVTADRAAFTADAAFNQSLGLTALTRLGKGGLRATLSMTRYDTSIVNSPLVDNRWGTSLLLGYVRFMR